MRAVVQCILKNVATAKILRREFDLPPDRPLNA